MMLQPEDSNQLFLALGRLEGKVDSLLALNQKLEEEVSHLDQRLRTLEHSRHFLLGISAVVGAGVSLAVSLFNKIIN